MYSYFHRSGIGEVASFVALIVKLGLLAAQLSVLRLFLRAMTQNRMKRRLTPCYFFAFLGDFKIVMAF